MATKTLRPTTATLQNSSNTSITNASNIWDANYNTYAEFKHTKAGSTTNYLWISGFDFSSIPANATISEAVAVVRVSTTRVNSSLYPSFYEGGGLFEPTQVDLGTFDKPLTDSSNITSATMTAENFETFKGYGSDAIIGIPIKRSVAFSNAIENIYEVYIEVTYTTAINNTRIGDTTPSKFYIGSDEVSKIYQGENLIYGG